MTGKAFIEFAEHDQAKAAVEKPVSVGGQNLTADFAWSKDHPNSKLGKVMRTVYVGNLDFNTEEWKLEEYFSQDGKVERVNMPKSPEGRARGFAFVQFENKQSAFNAIKRSGAEFGGRAMVIRKTEMPKRNDR